MHKADDAMTTGPGLGAQVAALEFARRYAGRLRFDGRQWWEREGSVWQRDRTLQTQYRVRMLLRELGTMRCRRAIFRRCCGWPAATAASCHEIKIKVAAERGGDDLRATELKRVAYPAND